MSEIGYDFEKSIGFWIGSTARAIEVSLNHRLSEHGITMRQVQVLACLAFSEELMQSDLAEMIGVEASTLVRIIDRMERDGWVARFPAKDDRRKKMIRATKKVKPIWNTIVESGEKNESDATKGIPAKDLKVVRKTLERMLANLQVEP